LSYEVKPYTHTIYRKVYSILSAVVNAHYAHMLTRMRR